MAISIANFIHHSYHGNLKDKPACIYDMKIQEHSKLAFSYKELDWKRQLLTRERMIKEIQKKESLLNLYENGNQKFSEYWLVLLVGSLNSANYDLDEFIDYSTGSKFDKVYLLSDYHARIVEVK